MNGIFDSITDYLGFSPTPAVPSNPAPAPLYDVNAQLSGRYRLSDLIKTNQSLSAPNIPPSAYMFDNLAVSAATLEYLESRVGPFQILSGFRTKELQDILAAQGEPVSKGLSFHEVGRGFDIYPTTMTPDEFMGLILAQDDVKSQFAEIAVKPSQNALHLATNVPGDIRSPKVTALNDQGSYVQLTLDQLAKYVEPYVESVDAAYYQAANLVTVNRAPMFLLAGLAMLSGAYFIFSSNKQKVRKNPRGRKVNFTMKQLREAVEAMSLAKLENFVLTTSLLLKQSSFKSRDPREYAKTKSMNKFALAELERRNKLEENPRRLL